MLQVVHCITVAMYVELTSLYDATLRVNKMENTLLFSRSVFLYARRSNQSILKEISHGCSLEGLMLKLNLQYFGHLMQRADSFEKTLMLRQIEGRRRRGRQRMRWLDGITDSKDMDSWSWWWTGRPGMLWFMGSQRVGHNWATELKWFWPVWGDISL